MSGRNLAQLIGGRRGRSVRNETAEKSNGVPSARASCHAFRKQDLFRLMQHMASNMLVTVVAIFFLRTKPLRSR